MNDEGDEEREPGAVKEWLFTYGWAILILAVMVGGLWYFGIFDREDVDKTQPGWEIDGLKCEGIDWEEASLGCLEICPTCMDVTGQETCDTKTRLWLLEMEMQDCNRNCLYNIDDKTIEMATDCNDDNIVE